MVESNRAVQTDLFPGDLNPPHHGAKRRPLKRLKTTEHSPAPTATKPTSTFTELGQTFEGLERPDGTARNEIGYND